MEFTVSFQLGSIVKLLKQAASAIMNGRPVSDRTEIVDAFRGLYFSAHGILPLLKDLHSGIDVSTDEVRGHLNGFMEEHPNVEYRLRYLNWKRLRQELDLDIPTLRRLERIGCEKIGIRYDVIRFVHRYARPGRKPKSWHAELGRLIKNIEELNAAIEEMDKLVNPALKQPKASRVLSSDL